MNAFLAPNPALWQSPPHIFPGWQRGFYYRVSSLIEMMSTYTFWSKDDINIYTMSGYPLYNICLIGHEQIHQLMG